MVHCTVRAVQTQRKEERIRVVCSFVLQGIRFILNGAGVICYSYFARALSTNHTGGSHESETRKERRGKETDAETVHRQVLS